MAVNVYRFGRFHVLTILPNKNIFNVFCLLIERQFKELDVLKNVNLNLRELNLVARRWQKLKYRTGSTYAYKMCIMHYN